MARLWQEIGDALDPAVFDAIPAEVAVLDEHGVIVAVNSAWTRAGDPDGDPTRREVGSNYLEFWDAPSGSASAHTPSIGNGIDAVLNGTCHRFSTEYARVGNDQQRWMHILVSPLPSTNGGAPRGAVVMHLDISGRKLAEMARVRRAHASLRRRAAKLVRVARALKRSNDELDQFAYITSHDLRAPIRGIANLSRWIEEDMGERFTSEAHAQMELLRGRVHRMENLIDAILRYARVGRDRLLTEPVNVLRLIDETVDLLAPPAGLKVRIEGEYPVVSAPKVLLQQVFLNLIGNAIKHHGSGDGEIRIQCRESGRLWRFVVRDDGPGIDPQYHNKIFVMFQTLVPRDRVEGTGVGLALVKKIVESQGGRISVESRLGHGAAFAFTWPRELAGDPYP